jgi:hypothetical protein
VPLPDHEEVVEALLLECLDPALGVRGPTRCTVAPSDSKARQKASPNFLSPSMINRLAESPQSCICMEALRACWATHPNSGFALGAETITRRLPTWMKNKRYRSTKSAAVSVRTERKSAAQSVAAWRLTNSCQVPSPRLGPGSMPASRRMDATVVLPSLWTPSFLSSPSTRVDSPAVLPRQPQDEFTGLLGGLGPAGLPGGGLSLDPGRLGPPAAEGAVGDDRDELADGAAQRGAEFQQARSLAGCYSHLPGEPGAEYLVLLAEVFHHLVELGIRGGGQE